MSSMGKRTVIVLMILLGVLALVLVGGSLLFKEPEVNPRLDDTLVSTEQQAPDSPSSEVQQVQPTPPTQAPPQDIFGGSGGNTGLPQTTPNQGSDTQSQPQTPVTGSGGAIKIDVSSLGTYTMVETSGIILTKDVYFLENQLYCAVTINLDTGKQVRYFVSLNDMNNIEVNTRVSVDVCEYVSNGKTIYLVARVSTT